MGEIEKTIIKNAKMDRSQLPDKVANAPQLWIGLELYWEAFQKLTTCRSSGMGEGAIPWTAVSQYCRDYTIQDLEREDFEFLVDRMDREYMKVRREQAERSKPSSPVRKVIGKRR